MFHIYSIGLAIAIFLGLVWIGFEGGNELEIAVQGLAVLMYSIFWPVVLSALALFFIGYFPIWIGKGIRSMEE